ncbi:hypothetical protein [Burkholderia ubonensis]|uniref:hypothetical protein n=1 Tax=Burkholderia ubonensis TaxID=101571 RepID=UPI0009B3BCDF|nr:hypothetical protein [Burkholderia ubonensis]
MLFLLDRASRSVSARAANSSIQAIQSFRPALRGDCGGERVAKGEKKNRRVRRRFFSGILVALYAPSTLSIRQRSEMPKKVKVKLGGHDGKLVRQKS